MSDILIYPSKLKGEITPPPSKSITHRAIICAAISEGDCLINNISMSNDIEATICGMKAMGSRCEFVENKLFVTKCVRNEEAYINCKESGSTMRFLIPIAAALGITAHFSGEGRLPERSIIEYEDLMTSKGINVNSNNGFLPLHISGKMSGGKFEIRGDVSSQFVSGLLLAAPKIGGIIDIILTTELQSAPYVDITIDVMNKFGVQVKKIKNGYRINANSKYYNSDYTIESDYSQGAFWLTANALGSNINVIGLKKNSIQGDKEILNIISKLKNEDEVIINASNIPDLIPIVSILAGLRRGRTIITNAERLKLKESDRLYSTSLMLNTLGADYKVTEDGFIINGVSEYQGGVINSYNDHRIAMSAAIASTRCRQPLKITGYECVNKSYPNFFDEFERLGGRVK